MDENESARTHRQKAKAYHEAREIADKAYEEVTEWLNANTGADGVFVTDLYITDEPHGLEQGEGEYCKQTSNGWSEDSYSGTYYHPIEGSAKYLAYNYEC